MHGQFSVDRRLVVSFEEPRIARLGALGLERHTHQVASPLHIEKREGLTNLRRILAVPHGLKPAFRRLTGTILPDHLGRNRHVGSSRATLRNQFDTGGTANGMGKFA